MREQSIFIEALEKSTRPNGRPSSTKRAAGDPRSGLGSRGCSSAIGRRATSSTPPPPAWATGDPPVAKAPARSIGPYKLLEQIGEGGMGVVYMAEQTQPRPRQGRARRSSSRAWTRSQVIARFEAERQALALMDHPNIAKVLDAGATDAGPALLRHGAGQGRPDHRVLRPAAGSRSASGSSCSSPVCQAVQHAHQKGIIHRDLKPSNVLVDRHDGTPVPKVIDFGVAKATGPAADRARRSSPASRQIVGTPLYMSPEQAELDGARRRHPQRHLLPGRAALRAADRHDAVRPGDASQQAAFDEMRRIIREEEPPRPSTRLSTLRRRRCRPSRPSGRPTRGGSSRLGARRARLDRDEGAGEGPPPALRDGQRLRRRRAALPGRRAGAGLPAVGVVPGRGSSPGQRNRVVLVTGATRRSWPCVAGTAVSTWQAVLARKAAAEADHGRGVASGHGLPGPRHPRQDRPQEARERTLTDQDLLKVADANLLADFPANPSSRRTSAWRCIGRSTASGVVSTR